MTMYYSAHDNRRYSDGSFPFRRAPDAQNANHTA